MHTNVQLLKNVHKKFKGESYKNSPLVRQKGLEPLAYCLEGSCSIQLSYWRVSVKLERVTGIEPASPAWKAGALAIVLHPRAPSTQIVSLYILP